LFGFKAKVNKRSNPTREQGRRDLLAVLTQILFVLPTMLVGVLLAFRLYDAVAQTYDKKALDWLDIMIFLLIACLGLFAGCMLGDACG
jgi:hypothetical protein